MLGDIASRWAEDDPTAAVAWAAGLPKTKPPHPLAKAVGVWAASAPEAAAAYVTTNPENNRQRDITMSVVRAWSENDPERAARWSETFVEDKLQHEAWTWLAQAWENYDPDGAAAWVLRLPESGDRDMALQVLCFQALSKGDRERAEKLSSFIQNEEERENSLSIERFGM